MTPKRTAILAAAHGLARLSNKGMHMHQHLPRTQHVAGGGAFNAVLGAIIASQRAAYVAAGVPSAAVRIDRLERAAAMLASHKEEIVTALAGDFGHRSRVETLVELVATVNALRYAAEHVTAWMTAQPVPALTPEAAARIEYTPVGVVGIIGPWNFPYNLTFGPLAGVLAAGNRAVIKPSEFAPAAAAQIARMVAEAFPPDEVTVVQGGPDEGAQFAAAQFDHLIFTGSASVASHVLHAAADNLTPVTLELGGKSPVIVTGQFDLAEAAARVMTVKTFNGGQICLAPDHVYVPAGSEREFADACVAVCAAMYPAGTASPDYSAQISGRHYGRMQSLVDDALAKGGTIISALDPVSAGSNGDHRFPPTLLLDTNDGMRAMQEEIFGPILPVIGYVDIDEVLATIRSGPRPLALYYFGADDANARTVLDGTASGGVTINDVMTHNLVEALPFGGIGASGMGSYHGHAGFATFSHARAIYSQGGNQSQALLRAPYGAGTNGGLVAALAT